MALFAGVMASGYFFWLRDSSFFSVRQVEVGGVTVNSAQVSAALQRAAQGMSTLDVNEEALRRAVGTFPTVGAISIDASPPHTLKVTVSERPPVAIVKAGAGAIPVSADGYLLRGVRRGQSLPSLRPSERIGGTTLGGHDVEQAELLGAAPSQLRKSIKGSAYDTSQQGVVVQLSDGIQLRLGDSSDAAAKWASAAAVLAGPKLGTPGYIDVSVPDRPVSGGR